MPPSLARPSEAWEPFELSKNPDAFRTISEVADELDLPQHVLRFWETRFSQIKPMKRAGGRRYYRPDDFELLQGIRHLLYDQGYTIKGVQKLLKQNGNKYVSALGAGNNDLAERLLMAKQSGVEQLADAANTEYVAQPPIDDVHQLTRDQQVVGMPKTPGALRFLKRQSGNEAQAGTSMDSSTANHSMAEEDRQLLQETLYDLLECKRLLDQTK